MVRETSRSPCILLVDPFVDEREMYADSLGFCGFEVSTCDDSAAALSFIEEHHTDAVIARIFQGDSINGVVLTEIIKHDARSADIPVIIITSYIQPYVRTAAEAAGCDAFLLLPCIPDRLAAELHRVTGNPRSRRPHTARVPRAARRGSEV